MLHGELCFYCFCFRSTTVGSMDGSTTISAKKYGRNFLFYYFYYYFDYTSFYRYSTLYKSLYALGQGLGTPAIHVQEPLQELMDRRGHDYADTYVAPSLEKLPRSVVRPRGGEC